MCPCPYTKDKTEDPKGKAIMDSIHRYLASKKFPIRASSDAKEIVDMKERNWIKIYARGSSSVGRASGCHPEGREFESRLLLHLKKSISNMDFFAFLSLLFLRFAIDKGSTFPLYANTKCRSDQNTYQDNIGQRMHPCIPSVTTINFSILYRKSICKQQINNNHRVMMGERIPLQYNREQSTHHTDKGKNRAEQNKEHGRDSHHNVSVHSFIQIFGIAVGNFR